MINPVSNRNLPAQEVDGPDQRSGLACLNILQRRLQAIYAVEVPHEVSDFVTTDAHLVSGLTGGAKDHLREKLLVRQDGRELGLSLYLHADVINTLVEDIAGDRLAPEYFASLCLAIEGTSHFLYLTWRALQRHSVSLLELELQSEVDKYVLIQSLIRRQKQAGLFGQLRQVLFENIKYDAALDADELLRYREANHYAARYCRLLESRYLVDCEGRRMHRELRQFYRLGNHGKLRRIDNPV